MRQNGDMPHTLWRPSLALALYRNRQAPASRFVQLATIRIDGLPTVRTLAFRGFLNETHRLMFAIDNRGANAKEIARTPWAAACWYFPVTHEQFRVGGVATIAGEEERDPIRLEARRECWLAMPESARLVFAWPNPGEPRERRVPFPAHLARPDVPLPNFCLMVLDPQEVDHLELNGDPQNRWHYRSDSLGRWSAVEVNP